MTTPLPIERVRAIYELRKDSARPDHREVAAICEHYLTLREKLEGARPSLNRLAMELGLRASLTPDRESFESFTADAEAIRPLLSDGDA